MGLLVAVLTVLSLTACNAQDAPGPEDEPVQTPQAASATTPPKPVIEKPTGEPPAELVIEELEPGEGTEAHENDIVAIHYIVVSWSTGEEYENTYDGGRAVALNLVRGEQLDAWVEGIPGMRVGGRRKLIVPPDKAYGTSGRAAIPPNETLILVLDLIAVRPPSE